MLFADLQLARHLERTNTLECVEYGRAHARLYPEVGATSLPLMGGYATYAGVDSPITQAFGLGLQGEVSEAEVDALEEFYFRRRVPVNIELCPLADVSLLNLLMARGYRIIETSNVLFQELNSVQAASTTQLTVRIPASHEADTWARVLALGFVETAEPNPVMLEAALTMFHMSNSVPFLVEVEGQPAGGGAVAIFDRTADFYGQATLPAFRRRGVQAALLQASLAYAVEQGCEIAMGTTMCGTTSQHNFERQGFRIAYTRIKLMRAMPSDNNFDKLPPALAGGTESIKNQPA